MDARKPALGIMVGGGPAPGLNGVISAVTIEARNNGLDVLGFYDGFKFLMEGSTAPEHVRALDIRDVSRIQSQGGCIIRTSRSNPTKKPEHLANCVRVLRHYHIKYLVTIGGDDTAYSASRLAEAADGEFALAHVPKTIDNDLPLPPGTPTFGYETARHYGAEIVRNLIADANTTARWYILVAMGRSAGHLALGIGKAAAAPLTLVPEEWDTRPVNFNEICDIIEGSIMKRRAQGRDYGVCILAEGLIEHMTREHLDEVFGAAKVDRDEHGHIRLDDIELGPTVRNELRRRFDERKLKIITVTKNLGYELRSADPIPFDREYTRDLGYGAVKFLLDGGSGSVINFVGGKMEPMPFSSLRDPNTGRPRVRIVDIHHEAFQVARKYMIRLDSSDRDNPERLAKMAAAAKLSTEDFLKRFGYLMK